MENNRGKTALITGGSGGLGYEFAKLCAADGINLILVARQKDVLDKIKTDLELRFHIKVYCIGVDLSVPEKAKEVYEFCHTQNISLEFLINNAGYGDYHPVADSAPHLYANMINLNIVALTSLTCLFVKDMILLGRGSILNIGSLAAFQPTPKMAVYGASKSFVMHFTEALNAELKGTGVSATVLNPGVTKTGFVARANMGKAAHANGNLQDATTVAEIGYQGMLAGKLNVVPGWINKIMAISTGLMPSRRLLLAISSFVMRENK